MIKGKVSIIIPSRHEKWLQPTIDDIFLHAEEDVEIIVNLDGYWPDPPLKDNPRLIQLHTADCKGMRAGLNACARVASGQYLLKSDGHCSFVQGFDRALKEDCDEDWVVIPRRYSLDTDTWTNKTDRAPVDYEYLSWCFDKPDDVNISMHGRRWNERSRERVEVLIDENLSFQGSCWFTPTEYFRNHIGPLDDVNYSTFYQEAQEIGLKVWLGGGKVMTNKKTHYSHKHKSRTEGTGYQFTNSQWKDWSDAARRARGFTVDYWMNNRWPQRKHDFDWLISRFWPLPGWPGDWQEIAQGYELGSDFRFVKREE